MIVDKLRDTIVTLKPLGNINTNPMMLKKYRVLGIRHRKMRVIFRRSLIDYHFRCGVDCKIGCIFSELAYLISPVCDTMRGIFTIDERKYAYYPEKDATEKI
jgi:hypothetical protein